MDNVVRLEHNHEVVGVLKKIRSGHGKITLTFAIKKLVEIPDEPGLKKNLQRHIEEKIGILHVDDHFSIRKIGVR